MSLTVPPEGYGGIENIVATLVPQLRRRGVRVVLATLGCSTVPVDERPECRREAARRFTPTAMAEEYLRLYQLVLARSRAVPRGRSRIVGVAMGRAGYLLDSSTAPTRELPRGEEEL